MTDRSEPPAAARVLLRLLPAEDRDEILADMAELFAARMASTGEKAARRWYRVHSLRLVLMLRWEQVRAGRPGELRGAKDDTRAARAWTGLQTVQDVRYVLRTLRRSPGFAATVILTLGLGIGATTAIFSVADAALFRPALYPDPQQLVRIYLEPEDTESGGFVIVQGRRMVTPSAWDLRNWQRVARSFESIATSSGASASFFAAPPEVERLSARAISADYLRVFGIQPFLGRGFTSQDQAPSAPPVVILGYRFWRDRLGGDRAVLGTPIRFEEGDATIIGILPQSLSPSVAVWRPMSLSALDPPKPTGLPIVARLKPGVWLSEAQAELTAITPAESPMRPRPGEAAPFLTPEVRALQGPTVWILLGAVGCVLLIACVNVAGLQFARGVSRQQELVVRSALGAGRWRLFRLVITESLLVAAVGGLLGVGLAWLALDALLAILPLQFFIRPVSLNPVVLTSAALVSIASGLAFGLLPAIRLSAVAFGAQSLRLGSGQRSTVATRRTGRILMAAEVALALVLLAGSTLMIRTLIQVHGVDLGFDPGRFVAIHAAVLDDTRAGPGGAGLSRVGDTAMVRDRTRADAFYDALLDRVRRLPDVTMAGAVTGLPLGGSYSRGADLKYLDGRPTTEPDNGWDIRGFVPGYFDTIGMRRVAGQWPSAADCAARPRPLVLNESAARRIFGADPAVGRLLLSGRDQEVHRILAVAGDVRHGGPLEEVVSEVYFCRGNPGAPRGGGSLAIVVRSDRPFPELAAVLRAAVLGVGERVTNMRIQQGDELFAERTALPRHRTQLLTILGGLGLLLAMVGVFGMTSYAVARRTREIGIRMAFGARPADAVLAIVRDAALPGAIGIALGLLAAYLSTPVLSTFLFQTPPRDPWAFASAAVALALAGLVAAWIPARHAARVNPVEALRAE